MLCTLPWGASNFPWQLSVERWLKMRLHDYLEYYARVMPDHLFAECHLPEGKTSISYGEANARANRMARAMLATGLEHGDRLAYLSRNSTDMVLMYFAAAKAGVVPVPLNYRLVPREWLYIINDAEAKLLIADAEYAGGVQAIRNGLTHVGSFVSINGQSDDWLEHESWLAEHEEHNLNLSISETDQLYQMYTSGTTGRPKGAMLSHRAIDANIAILIRGMDLGQAEERALIVVPLYHAGGGVISFACIAVGSTLVIHKDFDPVATLDSISEEGITVCGLIPAMVQACLVGVADIGNRKFPTLRRIIYGASPIAEETLRAAMRVFECDFVQGYGATETTATASCLLPEDHRRALDGEPHLLLSAGRSALGTEIRIVDEDGNEVPQGTIGEVAVKGSQLMTGYWHHEEATATTLKDGWMHTGDAAMMDEEGFIYIQDRIKDMIVTGGENVYPREIENALFEHPDIADAAVIGVPSVKWGEAILGFVVPRDGKAIAVDDLIEFCRERLAGYKVPRMFEFVDQLPRNASGKVLKKDLRAPYWDGVERGIS